MNKLLTFILTGIFLVSLVSANVSLETSPQELYNLGDHVEFVIKISPIDYFEDLLVLKLKCGTSETEIYKEFVITDVELEKEIKIPLIKDFIGNSKGSCEIVKEIGGNDVVFSDDFIISDKIDVFSEAPNLGITPGDEITITGTAIKENGEKVDGFFEIKSNLGEEILESGIVEGGEFGSNFKIPDGFEAGDRVLGFYVYEEDNFGNILNFGNSIDTIVIRQVPTNIEIIIEEKEVVPGENLKMKILLHDQTGERIDSEVYVAIKDPEDNIVERIETVTDVTFEYMIEYSQAPSKWSVSAYAEDIINNENFVIRENEEALFNLVNNTLFVKNIGNVPYNETLNISVGNEVVEILTYLEVGNEERYSLSAPTGEYDVRVGDIQERISLTGNAIKVKKISGVQSGVAKVIAWIFIILILSFMAYVVFRKGHKKSFFGKVRRKKKEKRIVELNEEKKSYSKGLIVPKVKTELSLSINGTKQNAIVGCISLKNYGEIKSGDGNVRETFDKISELIDSHKGLIYKNHGHLFFILAPVFTKTFKNEEVALKIANEIVKDLKIHNKKFKKKIQFGISLNYGTIVTKIGVHSNQFMSMGTLMTDAKKMANSSNEEIYLGEKVRERLGSKVKVEMKQVGSVKAYTIKELVGNKKDYSPFLKGFMERQQKERLAKENLKKKEELKKEHEEKKVEKTEDKKIEDSVEKLVEGEE